MLEREKSKLKDGEGGWVKNVMKRSRLVRSPVSAMVSPLSRLHIDILADFIAEIFVNFYVEFFVDFLADFFVEIFVDFFVDFYVDFFVDFFVEILTDCYLDPSQNGCLFHSYCTCSQK